MVRVVGVAGAREAGRVERMEKSEAFVPERETLPRLRVELDVLVMVKERVIWARALGAVVLA